MNRRAALDWVGKQADWVEKQISLIQPAEPFHPDAIIPFRGGSIRLQWDSNLPRSPRLADGVLGCGGPLEAFPARIERFLRAEARAALSEATQVAARKAGVAVRSVSVGDAATRWGSCSVNGDLRYNWRIVLAPPHLLEWLVAHEVAHRRHMNHGAAFHSLEASLYGRDVAAARAELRALGPRLKRIGRLV